VILHWKLDEVQESNPVDPLEDCCDPGKLSEPWEESLIYAVT